LAPVLIIAAGQLAGSLAWLAISGEDAPDLIASAPVTNTGVLRAKTEALLAVIALLFGPFIIALAAVAPVSALITSLGIAPATASMRRNVSSPSPGARFSYQSLENRRSHAA